MDHILPAVVDDWDLIRALPRDVGLIVQSYSLAAPFCFELNRLSYIYAKECRAFITRNFSTNLWIKNFRHRVLKNQVANRGEALRKEWRREAYWKKQYMLDISSPRHMRPHRADQFRKRDLLRLKYWRRQFRAERIRAANDLFMKKLRI